THPDPSEPSDLDLLTFAVFEGAFVCICTAYLFGGLAKDRIAARYRHASLTDPLTGVANRRGFFETGERLLMRARFAHEATALIMFDLDRFKSINDRYGHQNRRRGAFQILSVGYVVTAIQRSFWPRPR